MKFFKVSCKCGTSISPSYQNDVAANLIYYLQLGYCWSLNNTLNCADRLHTYRPIDLSA